MRIFSTDNGLNIEANSKEEAEELSNSIKKIPSLEGYADNKGNIYKVKYGVIKKINKTTFKDRHKTCYVFDNGKASLNEIMHETFPELDKTFGKIIPNTNNKLSMQSDGSIWSVGFEPERFDDKRNLDGKGRLTILGYRINPKLMIQKLYGDNSSASLKELEDFLHQNNIETKSNNGESFYAIIGNVKKDSDSTDFVVIKDKGDKFTLKPYVDFLSHYFKETISFTKKQKDFLKIVKILNILKNINKQIHKAIKDITNH